MADQRDAAPNPFPGETLDSDGHVYIHPDVFREVFPELAFGYNFEFLDGYVKHPEFAERRARNRTELWETKGLGALGAYDPDERVEALDRAGIKAQLMFANNTLYDLRATTKLALDLIPEAGLREPEPDEVVMSNRPLTPGRWVSQYMFSLAASIAGGASNIQRNIIGEHLLGLPRDPRPATPARN